MCDVNAENVIWGLEGDELAPHDNTQLETVAVFVEKEKMTSDTGHSIRLWVHNNLA